MKIKMITLYAGPGGVMEAGREYEVSAELGESLVNGHFAKLVEKAIPVPPVVPAPVVVEAEPDVIETADVRVEVAEKAVKPRAKK